MDTKFIDIHCHVNDKAFNDDCEATLLRMEETGVAGIIIGTDWEMSTEAVHIANTKPYLWAAIGQHPVDRPGEIFNIEAYRKLALDPKVVAIGECGLDYFWPSKDGWSNGEAKEKQRQKDLFEAQIALAIEVDKPLMLHGRPSPKTMDAYQDMLDVLRKAYETHGTSVRGNVHFFVGNHEIAESFFALGFTISFTGVVTFTHDYDDVIKNVSLERIMAETDAPYVSPAPYRGKRNEPIHVREVVKRIAEIRGEDEEVVRQAMLANASRSFGVNF